MSSEDSDDEPLSTIAALKSREIPEHDTVSASERFEDNKWDIEPFEPTELESCVEEMNVVERPDDVWLYLKDFNTTGPYSCLLCSEWFINKAKIVIHYVIDHQKDYCGICRYLVPDREAWWKHLKFHSPWKCSQCFDNFMTQTDLREHLSSMHKLIHCRICHLRLNDDEQYNKHLYQTHSVSNIASKCEDVFWDFEYEGSQNYTCLLCSKPNSSLRPFADHYLSYHHFTLKCFTALMSGTDLPFKIKGVELTSDFIETQLKQHEYFGYVEFKKPIDFIVKKEVLRNEDEMTVDCDPIDTTDLIDENIKTEDIKSYKGEEDIDVTLVELLPVQKCYFDYLNEALIDVKANKMPPSSNINYETANSMVMTCCFCQENAKNVNTFTFHMSKMHFVRTIPKYSCRVCVTMFSSGAELKNHISEEMGEFEGLWICQFCDKEFNNREETRKHLTEHWKVIEYDNCFSPHLGFKCMFCPTLFWNEIDREKHHVTVHYQKHKGDFYKCSICDELFGDKVFFIHHYIEKHNTEASYLLKCRMCCVVLNPDGIRSHFNEHHPEAKKIFCSLPPCKYKPFSHRKSFHMHVKTYHTASSRAAHATSCTTCGQQFASVRAYRAHVTQKHGPGLFKCTLCQETLNTDDERKIHYLLQHPGRYQYQCPLCDKSFQYKSSLYMHKQDHAPNKTDYACEFCGKVFLKKDSYREHILIHQAPRHACSYCPKRFVQRSNMLRHERRHTGERPYSCPICSRTFADKGACTSHSRTHLKDAAFTCMHCGKKFVQKSKLKYHIRTHTGEGLETCTVCSKKFTSGFSLREHMKCHDARIKSEQKTVKCPLCKLMYSGKQSMLRHMRDSHSPAKHPCPLCPKKLCSISALREHLISHTSVKIYRCRLCPKSCQTKRTILRHIEVRHKIKESRINMTNHYRRLEPRECNLGLDETVMNKIYGPPKKKDNEPASILPDLGTNSGLQNEDDSVNRHQITSIKIEIMEEPVSPDFVNVKTEVMSEPSDIDE